ncbi:MAG: hypothetical protein H3C43_08235 [Leptonema sp. (in: Bacteria)]|nr:hypothetical protein [Leptonema sp. (in: bacteria)]
MKRLSVLTALSGILLLLATQCITQRAMSSEMQAVRLVTGNKIESMRLREKCTAIPYLYQGTTMPKSSPYDDSAMVLLDSWDIRQTAVEMGATDAELLVTGETVTISSQQNGETTTTTTTTTNNGAVRYWVCK